MLLKYKHKRKHIYRYRRSMLTRRRSGICVAIATLLVSMLAAATPPSPTKVGATPVVETGFTSNTATASSLTLTKPSGVQTDDLLIIIVGNDAAVATAQWNDTTLKPAGFTMINEAGNGTTDCHAAAFYRVADGSEGSTINVPAASANDFYGYYVRVTGVDPSSPLNVTGADVNTGGGASSIGITGENTTVDDGLGFYNHCFDGGDAGGFSVSGTGWSESAETTAGGTGAGNASGSWGTKVQTTQGATGTATVANTANNDGFSGFQFALAPEPIAVPDAPVLHSDDGGSNQIAFNNIRQNSTTPTFRASAAHTASFDRFQLELNTASDFSGTSYTQTFSGTYSSGTQYNLSAASLSPSLPTTNGATYYVRARASADSGVIWGDWSSGTWSYTYKNSGDPDWFQTTDAQFNTGDLAGVQTSGSGSVELGAGGSPAHVQTSISSNNSSGGTSIAHTFPGANTAGNTIIVSVTWFNSAGAGSLTCSDTQGNSYTTVRVEYDSGESQALGVCYATNIAGGSSNQVTGSISAQGFRAIAISEYSGIAIASPVDVSDGQGGASGSTATDNVTSTATTTAQDGDLIYGSVMSTDGGNWGDASIAAGTNFTERSENDGLAVEDRVQTSAGSAAATFTFSNSGSYDAVMVALKAGGASSGTITSSPIDFDSVPDASSWNEFAWSEDETNGTISAQLYYTNSTTCDTVVPNSALSGNESGFASGSIDISGLNTTTYNEICLRATLTDSGGSPVLEDWTVTWVAETNTTPNAPTTLVQRKTDDAILVTGDWTNEVTVEFTAQASDTDNPENLQLCIEADELGAGFSDTEDSCGSAVAYSGSAVTVTHSITFPTPDGNEYHWQARIKDDENAYSVWVSYPTPTPNAESARDFGIDTSAPTGGNVYDGDSAGVDMTFNDGSLSELSANWANFNFDASGPHANARYEYSIGTTQGGTNVRDWTSTGTTASVTATGLTLQTSEIYYFNVRAVDAAGNVATVSSDGQFVLPTLSFSASPTSLTFDNLNSANSYTDTKATTLSTETNAFGGYAVRAWAVSQLQTADQAFQIPWQAGSWADPAAPDAGYGYTSSDSLVQGVNRFSNGTEYAQFSESAPGDIIADRGSSTTGSPEIFTITHRVESSGSQQAGDYSTTIIYIVTATY